VDSGWQEAEGDQRSADSKKRDFNGADTLYVGLIIRSFKKDEKYEYSNYSYDHAGSRLRAWNSAALFLPTTIR
jgi:hypothetical protein